MDKNIELLKYPIGKFQAPENIDPAQINRWIGIIQHFPEQLRKEVENLGEEELEKQYRPDGWTVRQVVHHCCDSHINAFIRFKLALTEDTPTIKPYLEHLWAELPDSKKFPIQSSLQILAGVHERWTYLMKNLSDTELDKKFLHPEKNALLTLKKTIGIYAWHCEHHLKHIMIAKNSK